MSMLRKHERCMQVCKHRKTTAIVIDTVAKRRRDLLALLVITKFSMTVFHFSLRFSPLGVQVVIREFRR